MRNQHVVHAFSCAQNLHQVYEKTGRKLNIQRRNDYYKKQHDNSLNSRSLHTHLSPGPSPGNVPLGVDRSFPIHRVKSRNLWVMTAHTTCDPQSSAWVRQDPSRNQPVMGEVEQGCIVVPRTLDVPWKGKRFVHQSDLIP